MGDVENGKGVTAMAAATPTALFVTDQASALR